MATQETLLALRETSYLHDTDGIRLCPPCTGGPRLVSPKLRGACCGSTQPKAFFQPKFSVAVGEWISRRKRGDNKP